MIKSVVYDPLSGKTRTVEHKEMSLSELQELCELYDIEDIRNPKPFNTSGEVINFKLKTKMTLPDSEDWRKHQLMLSFLRTCPAKYDPDTKEIISHDMTEINFEE
jgi:hypothetical protein